MAKFPMASPAYEVQYNKSAWFNPWCVMEVRVEGIGYKHYKKIKDFSSNADALALCNRLNGVDEKREVFKPSGGIYK